MVIDDLYVVGAISAPNKTDPPLIIDADAVLPSAATPQSLQPVSRRDTQIGKGVGIIDHIQLSGRDRRNRAQMLRKPPALEEGLSVLASEALYHCLIRSTYGILMQARLQIDAQHCADEIG
jgi:hypothetical protein